MGLLCRYGEQISYGDRTWTDSGSANTDRPLAIALRIINNAIGSNSNLMLVTQSGTPTFSYTAGQDYSGTSIASILANPAVPYVNCFAYADGAQTSWTTICFNNNLSAAESVSFMGVGAPSGTVIETLFGNSNLITDNNENTYLGSSSVAPVVNYPSSTTTSESSYTIPAASMMVLSYGTGNPPPVLLAPTFNPAAGTYTSAQSVTISDATSGATIYYTTTGTTPTTSSTKYTGPITVSSTEKLQAMAVATGDTNSAVASAAYTISSSTAVATTTKLTASATQITIGQSVVFTAKVVPQSGRAVPTGSIKFFDGTTSLGKASLHASGAATLRTSALSAGRHSITASYFGQGEDSSSVSNAVSVGVTQSTAPVRIAD